MTETYFLSIREYQYYDINLDAQVVRLMATSTSGTWHAVVPVDSARKLRERREAFKTYVLGCIQAGLEPHEATEDEIMESHEVTIG